MNLKDYTQNIAKKDNPLGDLAKDILRTKQIDWEKEDEIIIKQITARISKYQLLLVLKKFVRGYYSQVEVD